jgi:polar amino acid transport system permease protein
MTAPPADAPFRRDLRPGWPLALLALGAAYGTYELAASAGPLGRLIGQLLGIAEDAPVDILDRLIAATAAGLLTLIVGSLSKMVRFRGRVAIVWLILLLGFMAFAYNFDLKYSLIVAKFPFLAGLRLDPSGFIIGAAMTLFISVISIGFSSLIGFVAGLGRMSTSALAFGVATFYISFFRGTPLLLQIYLIYLGLAQQLNLVLGGVTSGIIALSLNYGAYLAEINRAGIESIDKGQSEAATALGLKRPQIMWKIVLPQAMRVIIPPTFSQFIAMLKDSSLVSLLGVWELMFLARSYGRSDFRYMEMLLTAAALYWAMSIVFELLQVRIERYYGRGFAGERRQEAVAKAQGIALGHH